jgi:hypothetical protein
VPNEEVRPGTSAGGRSRGDAWMGWIRLPLGQTFGTRFRLRVCALWSNFPVFELFGRLNGQASYAANRI